MLDKLASFAEQPTVSPLAVQNGNTPWAQRYAAELRDVVVRYADRLPRNVQRHLGPSELGYKCDRRLVGEMAGVSFGSSGGNLLHDPWASIVGTAIHAFLDKAFTWDSEGGLSPGRWIAEQRVCPDPGALQPHPGTADLYDRLWLSVDDHKGLALDTRIPTPEGWTTTGTLKEGDLVLGGDGKPCEVTRVYPVQYRDCYKVSFKGGVSLLADDVQLWEVSRNRNGGTYSVGQETVLLSTAELRKQLRAADGQRHLRVRTVTADLPAADLLVPPYVLGCWLGDGERSGSTIVSGDYELFEHIQAEGYSLGKPLRDDYHRYTPIGLRPQLRDLGVLGLKIIPAEYMRSSRSQRLALLQGLMDTDGSHNRQRNQCVFTSTSKHLADRVRELAASLGWKSYTCEFMAQGFGCEVPAYQTMFTPVGAVPFRLSRKAALVRPKCVAGAEYRIVQAVEPVQPVPTRCIDVNSPDHLYLATEQFIPVHNCQSEAIRTRLRRDGPPFHYFVQLLLYAAGYMLLGFEVQRVCLVSWPRTKSTLDDMYVWEHVITADDLRLVIDVLDKTKVREDLARLVTEGRLSFWEVPVTPSDEACQYCKFFNPAALEDGTRQGCPGTSMLKGRQ